MSRSQPLRAELKKRFYPFAQERGFVLGKSTSLFTPFERVVDGKVEFFEIQWDKSHRPRFVINFGERASTTPADIGPTAYAGRLQRWRGGSMRTWFQVSKPWVETLRTFTWSYQPHEVASHLMECFSELEAWWGAKQAGPHLHLWHSRAG